MAGVATSLGVSTAAIERSRDPPYRPRVALGASRRRVVLGFLMDATIVATLGGVFGVGMAYLGVEWFNGQIGDDFGRFWMHFAVDRTVLLFALELVCGAVPGILDALETIDASVPQEDVRPLNDLIRASAVEERTFGSLFMVFGGIALLLASVGLYGVVASAVSQGVREVGIRMALGAKGSNIVRHYVRQSLTPVLIGVAVGLEVGGSLAPLMGEVLMGSDPYDPSIYSGVPMILIAAGMLASVVPVVRVLMRDPMRALRQE